ncbi:MAG: ribulokinase [Acetivibrionales bacterium]
MKTLDSKYTIGIDFGSLSARAVLFDVKNGGQIGEEVYSYKHAVIDTHLPGSDLPLPPGSALQDACDYIEALEKSVKGLLRKTGVSVDDVIGVGVDFTSCTLVAIDKNGVPLSCKQEFKNNPHAYVKMWKQHTAEREAEYITNVAHNRGEKFLRRYGGRIFSEWGIPKILLTLREAPEIYNEAYRFIEAGDWIVMQLTGEECTSYCTAGYKFLWDYRDGYPSKDFFASLHPGLENVVQEKLVPEEKILPLDTRAGVINKRGAQLTGLREGTPVAVSRIDGHSAASAIGCNDEGKLLMIIGTGTGMVLSSKREVLIDGICGVCYGAVIPGYYGYEAGLSCCGDLFEWFVNSSVSSEYIDKSKSKGMNIYSYIEYKANTLKPGQSGLIALDWWNGNRSVLTDGDLSGVLIGMTLSTKPEEIYRALVEATGFSTKMIVDTYKNNGIDICSIFAVGGIPQKSNFLMQIYADILDCEITVPSLQQACALGSGIYAAVAAGKENGGYDSIDEAISKMSHSEGKVYKPNPDNAAVYKELYSEFVKLHDYFGKGGNDVQKTLKKIKMKHY